VQTSRKLVVLRVLRTAACHLLPIAGVVTWLTTCVERALASLRRQHRAGRAQRVGPGHDLVAQPGGGRVSGAPQFPHSIVSHAVLPRACLEPGHDVSQTLPVSLMLCTQEPALLEGSVADAIRYGKPDASMEAVRAASEAANAHDFIMALPQVHACFSWH